MNDAMDESGELLPDNERLTRIGSFLRRTSLDEIPQLLNVIKGDMSIVGPRPLLVKYLPLYNDFQRQRHEVHPGITGWAQINGRNAIEWDERFELDAWYVQNQSFLVDLKIILKTVLKLFNHEGVNRSEKITMTEFAGNADKMI